MNIRSFIIGGIAIWITVMLVNLNDLVGVMELLGVTAGVSVFISWRLGLFKKSNFIKPKTLDDLTEEDVQNIKEIMLKSIQESIVDGKAYPLQVTMTNEFTKHADKILKKNGFEHREEIFASMTSEFTEYLNRRVTLKNGGDSEE
ncbi:MAG: hypothetical protein K8Q89_02165 [Nitrosarchaeum sp.]|nr:hypothetical protein [Nitrosarchaeum sp.]